MRFFAALFLVSAALAVPKSFRGHYKNMTLGASSDKMTEQAKFLANRRRAAAIIASMGDASYEAKLDAVLQAKQADCKPGQRFVNNKCYNCKPGYYQYASGQQHCNVCNPGYYSKAKAAKATKCPSGTFSGRGWSGCRSHRKCGRGQRAIYQGSTTHDRYCGRCPSGTFQGSNSHTSATCNKCPANTYSSAGSCHCSKCPKGSSSNAGSAGCTKCKAGTYMPLSGGRSLVEVAASLDNGGAKIQPGCYRITTSTTHNDATSKQPAGWGLAAWHAHGAVRNGASSWAAVHSGPKWPMIWRVVKGTKPDTYRLLTTSTDPDHKQPGGWGLASWHAHGAVRNGASSRVAVHAGGKWPMNWKIVAGKKPNTHRLLTTAFDPDHKQPKDWGLATWQMHGGRRNSGSSWVYTHSGTHWPMDWTFQRVKCPAPIYTKSSCEGGDQAKNLGKFTKLADCSKAAAAKCGTPLFMWSKSYPSWGCRCCKKKTQDHGHWDMYALEKKPAAPAPAPAKGCVHCAAGTYSAAGASGCSSCRPGTYSAKGSSSCTACEAGQSSFANAKKCRACRPGRSSVKGGQCTLCAPGKFSERGKPTCTDCAKGQYAPTAGSPVCTKACPGHIVSEAGESTQNKCSPGTFQAKKGQSTCNKCAAGKFTNAAGQAECDVWRVCGAGKEEIGKPTDSMDRACGVCSPGKFSNSNGKCNKCKENTFQCHSGGDSCYPCGKGLQAKRAGATGCSKCKAGQFSNGNGGCEKCKAGTYSAEDGADDCDDCKPGSYAGTGATKCTKCKAGQFTNSPASDKCEACEAGHTMPYAGSPMACVACSPGTYAGPKATKCLPCKKGFFTDKDATVKCSKIEAGFGASDVGDHTNPPENEVLAGAEAGGDDEGY